jgi:hypothetical protein
MKYGLTCRVDSQIVLPEDTMIEYDGCEYCFHLNDERRIDRIQIVTKVLHPERFKGYFELDYIGTSMDKEVYDDLINRFQYLESMLAFDGELRKIHWEWPKQEFIAETEDEERRTAGLGTHSERKYRIENAVRDKAKLTDIIMRREMLSQLTVVQSFWREGYNEYIALRFINAFVNFYFVIEGMYGNGKTAKDRLIDEFWNSQPFGYAFKCALDTFAKNEPANEKRLMDMLNITDRSELFNSLVDVIVDTRGSVLHYRRRSTQRQGEPFRQLEYEPLAAFMKILATEAIYEEVNALYSNSEGVGDP